MLLVLCLALTVGMLVACDPGSSDQGGQGGNGGENAGSAGLVFEDIGGSYSVTGYEGTGGEVVIPETHNGLPVTSIGDYAFEDCTSLTSVTIPDSVTSIGGRAFYGCKSLESITLPFVGATKEGTSYTHFGYIFGARNDSYNGNYVPASLKEVIITGGTSIGNRAFEDCTSLTSVTIPDSVTSIGDYAFLDCTSLTAITIPDSVTNIGDYAFRSCTSLTSITIPDSVTSIGGYAFADCTSLTSITIPDSVTSIREYAFWDCDSLTSVNIPDSVTSIWGYAFYNCDSLASVTIGNGLTSIGYGAFQGCGSLESMTIPFVGAEAGKTAEDSYQYPFGYIFGELSYTGGTAVTQEYCYSTSRTTSDTYYIPSSLRSVTVTGGNILYGAFYGCSMLTSVTIPDSVTSIGERAFYNCTSLTSIAIPDSVTSIGDYAFRNCTGLNSIHYTGDMVSWCGITGLGGIMSSGRMLYIDGSKVEGEVIIPDETVTIPSYAFAYQTGITSVTIPGSVTSIGQRAFSGCAAEIIWGGTPTITAIGGYAFAGYAGTSITIPDSVTSIGEWAFSNCAAEIIWGGTPTITEIGAYAFAYYDGTSITIPDSVTSIGSNAFQGCNSLEAVHIADIVKWVAIELGDSYANPLYYAGDLYLNGEHVTDLVIPDSVTSIGDYAFYGCDSFASVTIPNSVTSIGSYAFDGCTSLTSVTIGNGVTSIGNWAFDGCTSLISVTIPDSVTSIGRGAFSSCSSLESLTIPFVGATKGGTSYMYFGYIFGAWNDSYNDDYVPASLKEVIITGGTSIRDYAFEDCTSLTSITIPDGVTSIGRSAFSGCTSLTSITMPNSVTSIGSYAFEGCTSLTSITIPDSVTSINDNAFDGCANIMSATMPALAIDAIPQDSLKTVVITSGDSIGSSAFRGCRSLTSITIPDSVTSIGFEAFRNCASLTSISIPSSVRSIGYNAFYACDSLASITFKGSVASIGHNAFDGCDALEIVDIASIRGWAGIEFEDETANPLSNGSALYLSGELVLDLVFPVGVATIKQYAFYNCSSITSVTLTHGVRTIGNQAFYGCDKLVEVYNGSQLDIVVGYRYGYVGYYAMNITQSSTQSWFTDTDDGYRFIYDATNDSGYLVGYYGNETELTLPDSFTAYDGTVVSEYQINDSAFRGCRSLTSITIPDSVTSIVGSAFEDCTSLTSVTIPDSVTSIGGSAFRDCTSLTSVTIGNGVTSIGSAAFRGCTSLTSITIPDSMTSIRTNAFNGCTSLASVIFEEATGWYYKVNSIDTGGTSLSSSSLADPSTAAQWLTSKYNQFDWYRE